MLPVNFNRWYIDDGSIVVLREYAHSVLDFLQRHGEPLGFSINLTKTKAYALHASQSPLRLSCEFKITGFCALGSPVGDDAFVDSYLQAKLETVATLLVTLETLEDPDKRPVSLLTMTINNVWHLKDCNAPVLMLDGIKLHFLFDKAGSV